MTPLDLDGHCVDLMETSETSFCDSSPHERTTQTEMNPPCACIAITFKLRIHQLIKSSLCMALSAFTGDLPFSETTPGLSMKINYFACK